MKIKRKRQLEAKRQRIATGTNNGWLNFSLASACRNCDDQKTGAHCEHRGVYLDFEEGRDCIRDTYEAKKRAGEK